MNTPKQIEDTYAISLSKTHLDYSDLLPELRKYFKDIPFNGKNTFMNVPVEVESTQLNAYSKLCSILERALHQVVTHYFEDERIRNIYQLDSELESILKIAAPTPYEVGLYRPDFVIDKNGQPKICEIGCRYPLNGWMLSYYMNLILDELSPTINHDWHAIPKQTEFVSVLAGSLDSNAPLYYVHEDEKGTEAYQFFDEINKHGFSIADISTQKLEVTHGELTVNGEIAEQLILELDREELKRIKPEVIKALVQSKNCLNDVRTLILVHDKRILSVLYNQSIMSDYLRPEDYAFLRRFLIPSYTLDSEQIRHRLIHSSSNWALKKNSGGRGIDIYVKDDCTSQEWTDVITNEWSQYMVQEYVDQQVFELNNHNQNESINIVGMLLCHNDRFFGTGIFRGSSKSVINVHSGGYILPSAISDPS